MKRILEDIINSFKSNKQGFSSRKLTAFVMVILVIILFDVHFGHILI